MQRGAAVAVAAAAVAAARPLVSMAPTCYHKCPARLRMAACRASLIVKLLQHELVAGGAATMYRCAESCAKYAIALYTLLHASCGAHRALTSHGQRVMQWYAFPRHARGDQHVPRLVGVSEAYVGTFSWAFDCLTTPLLRSAPLGRHAAHLKTVAVANEVHSTCWDRFWGKHATATRSTWSWGREAAVL